MWIKAPYHVNFANNSERDKFNNSLDRMVKFNTGVKSLELKKVWNYSDTNLYIKESRRFTSAGYMAYWEAIDRTVKYCDTILAKKVWPVKKAVHKDRFRWAKKQHSTVHPNHKNAAYNRIIRRKLPTPPRAQSPVFGPEQ